MKKGGKIMYEKRNQLITQAILDKLNTGTGIYSAEDILVAANISDQNLQKLLEQLEENVAESSYVQYLLVSY